jgi:hypothetical protein
MNAKVSGTGALHSVWGGQHRGGPASPWGQRSSGVLLWLRAWNVLGGQTPFVDTSHHMRTELNLSLKSIPDLQPAFIVSPRRSPYWWLKNQIHARATGPMTDTCVALGCNECVALPCISFRLLALVFTSVQWAKVPKGSKFKVTGCSRGTDHCQSQFISYSVPCTLLKMHES